MVQKIINVGSSELAGDGESVRNAFIKINENFTEVYSNTGNGSSVDLSWSDNSGNVFNVISWTAGKTINITTTPFETTDLVTYNDGTDSVNIYFNWDQNFIDTVWEGWNTPAGEGQSYSISFDNGVTWYPVERSGYNGGTFFYFRVPYDLEGQYSFTYTTGQTVTIRYNRGSVAEVWFDLADAPVSSSDIIGVDMSVVLEATIPGDPDMVATAIRPNYRFMNVLYDDNSGQGNIISGANIWSGSGFTEDRISMSIRKIDAPEDAGRVYARFNDGFTGTMTFYWNAKLYTITRA